MRFEWDEDKNQANITKHGVSFELASEIFTSPILMYTDERHEYGEVRSRSIGVVRKIAILAVIHTDRSGVTRLISARPANKTERRRYEQEIQKSDDS